MREMGTEVDCELVNDTYMTKRWFAHARNEYGDPVIRPDYHIPGLMVPILPEKRLTVIIDLRKPLSKPARKAIRYATNLGHMVETCDGRAMALFAIANGKKIGKSSDDTLMVYGSMEHLMHAKFYICRDKENDIIGGLTILHGDKWITERFSFGEQDAIKGRVIQDHEADFDYYDLAGLNTPENSPWWKFWRDKKKEAAINRYKEKWGEVKTVFLRMD